MGSRRELGNSSRTVQCLLVSDCDACAFLE
jgi:hypothetical protein